MSWIYEDAQILAKRILIKERFASYITLLFLGAEGFEQLEFAREIGMEVGCTRKAFKERLMALWTETNQAR